MKWEDISPLFRFPSFRPASLPLSANRVSLQVRAVSEFWRSTKGWEPFMVRIPNPDTTLRLPHTCTTSRARASRACRVRVYLHVYGTSVRVLSPACIRARTRVLLDARICICLECIASYALDEHSAALTHAYAHAIVYVWRKLHEDIFFNFWIRINADVREERCFASWKTDSDVWIREVLSLRKILLTLS